MHVSVIVIYRITKENNHTNILSYPCDFMVALLKKRIPSDFHFIKIIHKKCQKINFILKRL